MFSRNAPIFRTKRRPPCLTVVAQTFYRTPRPHGKNIRRGNRRIIAEKTAAALFLRRLTGFNTHVARQCPFSALFAFFVLTCACKPASQKTKIAQKLSAVGYKAVLPELIFVQARQNSANT